MSLVEKLRDPSVALSQPERESIASAIERLQRDRLPWYRKDRLGWPIETWKDRPVASFIRIVCQNIRKITG